VFELPLKSRNSDRQTHFLGTKGDPSVLSRAAYTLLGRTSIALEWRPCTNRPQGPLLIFALSVCMMLTGLFLLQLAQMGGQL
jgi:hypothetical protein